MFIGESTFQDEKFFAAAVGMFCKIAVGGIAHQGGGTSDFGPSRSNIRRSTPAMGEACQGKALVSRTTRSCKSAWSCMGLGEVFFDTTDKHFHPHSQGCFIKVKAGMVMGIGQIKVGIG